MKTGGQLIRDHRRMRTYTKCFSGEELVQWLLQHGEGDKEEEAVRLGQAMLENGLIHHGEWVHRKPLGLVFVVWDECCGSLSGQQCMEHVNKHGLANCSE